MYRRQYTVSMGNKSNCCASDAMAQTSLRILRISPHQRSGRPASVARGEYLRELKCCSSDDQFGHQTADFQRLNLIRATRAKRLLPPTGGSRRNAAGIQMGR